MITIEYQSATGVTVESTVTHVSSDQHIGHLRISELAGRGFELDEEASYPTLAMDNHIRDKWNAAVGPEDVVLVLGDIALGKLDYSLDQKWREFNGVKLLVPGNHDRIASTYSPNHRERQLPRYLDAGFIVLPELVTVTVEHGDTATRVLASHYPYAPDARGFEDRESQFQKLGLIPEDDGTTLLLHGHTHAHEIHADSSRQYHVGVDSHAMAPVPASVISEWVAEQVG